jgi:alanine racemase
MTYSAADITTLIAPDAYLPQPDAPVRLLLTDSRNLLQAAETLFFALPGSRRSGQAFVSELYDKGVRNFVVQDGSIPQQFPEANFFVVKEVLGALQQLAAYHRRKFSLPVIGITGSNGKTVVKEWLYQLLQEEFNIVRSPRSYNSQVGVPLSLWEIGPGHTLALIEAGISKKGEMQALEEMIRPTIGVFTNLGEAHSAGFALPEEKLREKFQLFSHANMVIAQEQYLQNLEEKQCFSWGTETTANLQVAQVVKTKDHAILHLVHRGKSYQVTIPFADDASVQNAITCCAVCLYLGQDLDQLRDRFARLHAVDMRLHYFEGINGCNIINDSYSADLTSLAVALNFMEQQQTGQQRTAILSDFVESDRNEDRLYKNIATALQRRRVQKVIGIGERISELLPKYLAEGITASFYPNTEAFWHIFAAPPSATNWCW